MFYMDLLEAPELALEGYFKRFFIIINDYTRYGWDYDLKTKNQIDIISYTVSVLEDAKLPMKL